MTNSATAHHHFSSFGKELEWQQASVLLIVITCVSLQTWRGWWAFTTTKKNFKKWWQAKQLLVVITCTCFKASRGRQVAFIILLHNCKTKKGWRQVAWLLIIISCTCLETWRRWQVYAHRFRSRLQKEKKKGWWWIVQLLVVIISFLHNHRRMTISNVAIHHRCFKLARTH